MTAMPPPEAFAWARLAGTLDQPLALPVDDRGRHRPLAHRPHRDPAAPGMATRDLSRTVRRLRAADTRPVPRETRIQPQDCRAGESQRRTERACLILALTMLVLMIGRVRGWF